MSDVDIENSVSAANQPLLRFLNGARLMRARKHRAARRRLLDELDALRCERESDPEVQYHLVFKISVMLDFFECNPNGATTALIRDGLLRMLRAMDPAALTLREQRAQMSDDDSPAPSLTEEQTREMELLYPPPTEARQQQWANEFDARRANSSSESEA